MYNKKFSKGLCDQYDPQGKRVAVNIMKDVFEAELLTENTAESSGDFSLGIWDQLFRLPDGKEWKVDAEIKVDEKGYFGEHWVKPTGLPFKWPTMDVPYRKVKSNSDAHLVISSNEDYAWFCMRSTMDECVEAAGGPKFKITKYEPQGGYFFGTPSDQGIWIVKKSVWERWSQ